MESTLTTERLTIIPCTLELVRAIMNNPHTLSAHFNATVQSDWPQSDLKEALPHFLPRLEEDPQSYVWFVWVIVSNADQTVIGDIGFKGMPDSDGAVEIGYSILPAFRNRGFAFEAAHALICWATRAGGAKRVVAECATDNAPSVRLLDKLRMVRTGEDDETIRWEFMI